MNMQPTSDDLCSWPDDWWTAPVSLTPPSARGDRRGVSPIRLERPRAVKREMIGRE